MITGLLERAVRADSAKTAIVHGAERISYGELRRRSVRCAAGLRRLGIAEGDCVAVILHNCPEFIVTFFACATLGAIFLPLNPGYTREELERFLRDGRPKAIVWRSSRLAALSKVSHESDEPVTIVVGDEVSGAIPFADLDGTEVEIGAPHDADRRALYLYTSGSTDTYKRICCTQRNLYFEARNFVETVGLTVDDTILCTIPLYHSYGIGNCLLDAVYLGATLVLEPDSDTPFAARHHTALELLASEDVRFFPGVPFQFEILAKSDSDIRARFRNVKWCVSSGDVLPKRTFDRFLSRTGHPIRSLYGSTEAGSIAMDAAPPSQIRFGSLGPPLENVEIEVRGEAGQIWVKSPVIPPGGYDNRPELNPVAFCDGFYNTSDVGCVDSHGHLMITGRKQSFFDVGGHKVDLAELEEVLAAYPKIREAAAIGLEVPGLGGAIKAVVAADENCRESDILEHCRRRLAAFKIPRFIEFREMLPRSPLGKILRSELSDPTNWLADVSPIGELPQLPHPHLVEWLAARIRDQVVAILRCDPDAVVVGVSFQNLGFDSLRVIELQERLSRMSGLALSVTTLWNYPSVLAYADFLLGAMRGSQSAPPSASEDDLDLLSDDEIATMLADELQLTGGQT